MSTSRGDSETKVAANRQLFLQEFGINAERLAEPVQISSDGVKFIDTPGKYANMDALITTAPGVYLRVLTADCSPILIWSYKHPLVAAVHSGWQGSERDILGKTLKMMHNELGGRMESICMVIGPGLSQANFEVGPEFRNKFPSEFLSPLPNSDRYLFNNNSYLKQTAIRLGVPANQIETLPYCSYKDDDLFYSHRRDGGTTGRMMSVIGINQ